MGWDVGDGFHEGRAGCVVPDGRVARAVTGAGVLVEGVTGRYPRDEVLRGHELVPDKDVVGWQGACECGWQGVRWDRVRSSAQANLSKRRAYVAFDGFATPPVAVEDAILQEWRCHVASWEVDMAARNHARALERLNQAVAAARTAGASWADIGRDTGMSRQSAHERWTRRPDTRS
ncbi:hypothetical protein [Arthrobacter cavernae]|uniref:Uncharacterized protein n=1 Tax=Arthrobacter cavernae TaxID=2817681 RepID=A0A939HK52_9MICC|nr:hypothetical protein [Arthrobacter cavernae]MBO1269512.1 hypothetical protein [Arthrobacter cavernae]